MDPLTLATSFATIVSLLGTYSSERRGEQSSSYEDFMQWLVETNHQEILEMIRQSDATVLSIKALLNQNHQVLAEQLRRLDESMAQIASGFVEFREVALWAHPTIELSPQAISILEAFYDSGASKMLERHYKNGTVYQYADGSRSSFIPSELRFIDDDLNTLVELGLLNCERHSGGLVFKFTRKASKYIEAIRGSK